MTTASMKKEIAKNINVIQSEDLIKAIYMLLDKEVKQMQNTLKPFSMKEFYGRNEKSQKDIKAGRLTASAKLKAKYNYK